MRLCMTSARSGTSLLSAEGPVLTLAPVPVTVSPGACISLAHARLQGTLCCARSFFEGGGIVLGGGEGFLAQRRRGAVPGLLPAPPGCGGAWRKGDKPGPTGLGGQLHCPQPGRSQKVRG